MIYMVMTLERPQDIERIRRKKTSDELLGTLANESPLEIGKTYFYMLQDLVTDFDFVLEKSRQEIEALDAMDGYPDDYDDPLVWMIYGRRLLLEGSDEECRYNLVQDAAEILERVDVSRYEGSKWYDLLASMSEIHRLCVERSVEEERAVLCCRTP